MDDGEVRQEVNLNFLMSTEKDVEAKEETLREAGRGTGERERGPLAEPVAEPEAKAEDMREEAAEAEVLEEDDRKVTAKPPGLASDEDDERASLTLQLAWLTKNLIQYEAISRMRRVDQGERMAALTESQQENVDRWYTVFEQEIGVVKQFRNALIHNPYAVDIDELREAVRIGRRLMRILLNGIGVPADALDSYGEPRAPGDLDFDT